MIPFHMLGIVS